MCHFTKMYTISDAESKMEEYLRATCTKCTLCRNIDKERMDKCEALFNLNVEIYLNIWREKT